VLFKRRGEAVFGSRGGNANGRFDFFNHHSGIFPGELRIYPGLRTAEEVRAMNILYLISGIIAVGLLIYLFWALLKPEDLA